MQLIKDGKTEELQIVMDNRKENADCWEEVLKVIALTEDAGTLQGHFVICLVYSNDVRNCEAPRSLYLILIDDGM